MLYRHALLAAAAVGVTAIPAPVPQGVTGAIPPSSPPPAGCGINFGGTFGIVVIGSSGSAASQLPDGQPQAPTGAAVTQITDGQPQAPTGVPVTQISDGQPQAPTGTLVTQISDGQIQAPTMTFVPVQQISDGQPQAVTAAAVQQISDGQPQAPTAAAVTQISDGQIQAPTGAPVTQISDGQIQAPTGVPVTQISDGQPQAPTGVAVTQISDGQPQATPATGASMVACESSDTLTLTLSNSILTDSKGRTGYIAANNQFQFDEPPQTGAIFTSGFSVCPDGSLALGGSTVFYQCLSGSFYNLYDLPTAAQCSPVTISVVSLESC